MFKNRRWSALVVAALGALAIPMAVSGPATAAPSSTLPTVQVAAASNVPVTTQGEVFRRFTAQVVMGSASDPYLTGQANADGPIYVDDVLEISVCDDQSQLCNVVYSHDFSNGCTAPGPQPLGPIFIGGYLNPGYNEVHFTLRDLCGQHEGSSDIYLTGYGVVDPTMVTSKECKGNLSKWLGGLIGDPFYQSQSTRPSVGADRKIHGTGIVDVKAKVNCSAIVQITLQTRVCNRFGGNCNARDIASTSWDPLPDAGAYVKNLTGNCRTGKDDYRVQVHVRWIRFDGFEGPVPILTQNDASDPDGDTGWTSLNC
jgi:hypothetical protein